MANLRVIAEIKPAGDFPVVDAPNVSVAGGKRLDVALSEAAAEVAKKANKSEVDTALASKANKSEVDAALASKANKSEVDAALAGKANKSEVDAAIENKADKSAFEAINASVSVNTSNIQELSTESTVLSARMDEFTKLKEGSTTGDAELIDGRVSADGKTYNNIGGAIRGQVTDLKSDLSAIATEEVSVQLLDQDNFIEGYTLQVTDSVSTPEDLTENSALFVTNVITFDEPLTTNTNFAININGVSRILSYRLLNGNYVKSGNYTASNIIKGSNYRYITISATEQIPIYKIRISAVIASNPDFSTLYFCRESEWSKNMSLEYYNYL
ncbi:MAG: hypothetical protein PUB89_01630, partial [Oscillospiraceae bacterium]|nr:hypothetical protein [Oscillospiraceae bacterium]